MIFTGDMHFHPLHILDPLHSTPIWLQLHLHSAMDLLADESKLLGFHRESMIFHIIGVTPYNAFDHNFTVYAFQSSGLVGFLSTFHFFTYNLSPSLVGRKSKLRSNQT